MQTLTDDLVTVLDREADLYSQVLDLVEEERQALVSGPPDAVLGIVRRKDTLLLKIRTVDESRDLICMRLARQWGLARKNITLSEIVMHCEGSTAGRMKDVRSRLSDCVERLSRAGRANAVLCHSGIETIRRVIENLAVHPAEMHAGGPQYDRKGSAQAAKPRPALNVRT